jgi:hypothetical protein
LLLLGFAWVAVMMPGAASFIGVHARFTFGILLSLAIALWWGFVVTRDAQRFWPDSGLRRFGLLVVAAASLVGLVVPPLVYTLIFMLRVDQYSSGVLADMTGVALGGALWVLSVFLVVRETTLRFALTMLALFVAYFILLAMVCALKAYGGVQILGILLVLHWIGIAVVAVAQWLRRSATWWARSTAVLLAYATTYLAAALVLACAYDHGDASLCFTAITSFLGYLFLSPLVHGNLARLRFLPRP